MGTIAQELDRIVQAKADIISSLVNKGATVPQDALIDDLPDIIDELPSGGGGDTQTLIDLIERDLTSITIPNSVTSIGQNAFSSCTSLTSATIGNSVTSIGQAAFYGCALTNITIPDSVTSIGQNAFGYCPSLTTVTIGNSVTIIDASAFLNCTSLTSVTIGNSVTSIGIQAFRNCTGLTSVTIGSGVTSIGNLAFSYCSSLASVTIEATNPPTLGNANAFSGNASGRKIYVPASSVEAYKAANNWSTYAADIEAIPSV